MSRQSPNGTYWKKRALEAENILGWLKDQLAANKPEKVTYFLGREPHLLDNPACKSEIIPAAQPEASRILDEREVRSIAKKLHLPRYWWDTEEGRMDLARFANEASRLPQMHRSCSKVTRSPWPCEACGAKDASKCDKLTPQSAALEKP